MGDKLLLRLNIYGKPIANKYCEGKMKSSLKRGSKDLKSLTRKGYKSIIPFKSAGQVPRYVFTSRKGVDILWRI